MTRNVTLVKGSAYRVFLSPAILRVVLVWSLLLPFFRLAFVSLAGACSLAYAWVRVLRAGAHDCNTVRLSVS